MPEIGKEPNQEPVQLAPIPPYPMTTLEPERSKGSSTPPPVQRVRGPEPANGVRFVDPQKQPEYVPVSHSPMPARTKPFFPSRPAPVQYEPVSTVHEAQTEVPPLSSRPSAKQPETLTPVNQKELTPVHEKVPEKINEKLSNQPQSVNFPVNFLQPNFKCKLTKKLKFRGRKGRQRTNEQVVELLTFVQMKGTWPHEISDQMCRYYKREYPEYFRSRASKRKVQHKGQVHA